MPSTAAPPRTGMTRGPVRRSRRPLRRLVGTAAATVAAGALAVAGAAVTGHLHHAGEPQCSVAAAGSSFVVTPEQAVNAATVSAVAIRMGLPHHAVTVALATALQESKLRNLGYGDRDSLGLFQQRPSQGWGSAAQVSDPTYAAAAFYRALQRLPGWQNADVATAAQAVQHSADGSAYASWEPEARALAVALTGDQPAAFVCSGAAPRRTTTTPAAVSAAAASALGPAAIAPGTDVALGRATSAWLVAHTQADGITAVAYDGYQWTAARGSWAVDPAAASAVTFTLAPPAT